MLPRIPKLPRDTAGARAGTPVRAPGTTRLGTMLIIGDVMLDVIGDLSGLGPDEACDSGHVRESVALRPGGTGLVAAVEARGVGFDDVGLWGSIGGLPSGSADPGGEAALLALREADVRDLLRRETRAPTGTVVQFAFADGRRLMVADPGANTMVDEEGPSEAVSAFAARSDTVFVSGYVMTSPARAVQVCRLVELARSHGAVVVLDVVPHRIEQLAPSVVTLLSEVDVVIGEAGTLHHLFGPGGLPTTEEETEDLARRILRNHRLAVVRPSNERELIAARGERIGDQSGDGSDDGSDDQYRFLWADTGYGDLSAIGRSGSHDRRNLRILAEWSAHTRRSP